jgi:uracil-DNA glycosylase family 4
LRRRESARKTYAYCPGPGTNEDREGRMFIGPSGKVLDELLRIVHIDRKEIYMTNLIKCMLPKYRKPKSDEIAICSWYLDREIEFINPRILASLGYYPTRYLFGKYFIPSPPKSEFHGVYGKFFEAGNKEILRSFRKLKVKYAGPCHCSGDLTRQMFKKEFHNNYINVGVGRVIQFK